MRPRRQIWTELLAACDRKEWDLCAKLEVELAEIDGQKHEPFDVTAKHEDDNDRWWQMFAAPLAIHPPVLVDEEKTAQRAVTLAKIRADFADAAIAEAKARGRL
jgi:hypothetical protein